MVKKVMLVKYLLLSVGAVAICLAVGWLVVWRVARWREVHLSRVRHAALSLACAVVMLCLMVGVYLGDYYRPSARATKALASTDVVQVREERGWLLFDGPSTEVALIFFPGAKVAAQAYAPLMQKLAAGGVDCVLVDPPANFALLGSGAAQDALTKLSYAHWYVGGHSLGGVVASTMASSEASRVEGVVLLASYPTDALPEGLSLLSIYGSSDQVLAVESYEQAKEQLWPPHSSEVEISGGNHAQFGSYGVQRGDGQASIPEEEQQAQTAAAICAFAAGART